jgi:hypothetical protein
MTTDPKGETREEGDDIEPAESRSVWKSGAVAGAIFALMGGILVFVLLQQLHPVFTDEEAVDGFGIMPAPVQARLDKHNAIFVLALFGGMIAAGVAVAEGLARKSWVTALIAGIACAAVAATVGALAGYLGNIFSSYYVSHRPDVTDLVVAVQVYGGMFALMGGGIGLAAGLFLGRQLRIAFNCVIGGVLAGFLSGLAYPVICALALPTADTKAMIPVVAGGLFFWCAIPAALIGGLIPSIAQSKKK